MTASILERCKWHKGGVVIQLNKPGQKCRKCRTAILTENSVDNESGCYLYCDRCRTIWPKSIDLTKQGGKVEYLYGQQSGLRPTM